MIDEAARARIEAARTEAVGAVHLIERPLETAVRHPLPSSSDSLPMLRAVLPLLITVRISQGNVIMSEENVTVNIHDSHLMTPPSAYMP